MKYGVTDEINKENDIKKYYKRVYSDDGVKITKLGEEYEYCKMLSKIVGQENINVEFDIATIIDAGCGIGTHTAVLAKIYQKKQVIGVDISEEAGAIAQKNYEGLDFYTRNLLKALDVKGDFIYAIGFRPFLLSAQCFSESVGKLLVNTQAKGIITSFTSDLSGRIVGDHYGQPTFVQYTLEDVKAVSRNIQSSGCDVSVYYVLWPIYRLFRSITICQLYSYFVLKIPFVRRTKFAKFDVIMVILRGK
jgi:SAM-dependent methyltransferase